MRQIHKILLRRQVIQKRLGELALSKTPDVYGSNLSYAECSVAQFEHKVKVMFATIYQCVLMLSLVLVIRA